MLRVQRILQLIPFLSGAFSGNPANSLYVPKIATYGGLSSPLQSGAAPRDEIYQVLECLGGFVLLVGNTNFFRV